LWKILEIAIARKIRGPIRNAGDESENAGRAQEPVLETRTLDCPAHHRRNSIKIAPPKPVSPDTGDIGWREGGGEGGAAMFELRRGFWTRFCPVCPSVCRRTDVWNAGCPRFLASNGPSVRFGTDPPPSLPLVEITGRRFCTDGPSDRTPSPAKLRDGRA